MRLRACALALLASSQSIYYKLDSDWQPYGNQVYGMIASYGDSQSLGAQDDPTWHNGIQKYTCKADYGIGLIEFYDHPYIRDNLCVVKCAADPGAPGCFGFLSPDARVGAWDGYASAASTRSCMYSLTDDSWEKVGTPNGGVDYFCDAPMNDLLCGTIEEIAAMCTYVDDCHTFTVMGEQLKQAKYKKSATMGGTAGAEYSGSMEPGVVGRLYSKGCGDSTGYGSTGTLATSAAVFEVDVNVVSYWVQKISSLTIDACPLGVGVEVFFGEVPAVRGLYQMDDAETYTMIGASHRIQKDALDGGLQCGWSIFEDVTTVPAGAGAGPACLPDNNLALNYMLDQCDGPGCQANDPDYQDNLCAMLMTVWSDVTKGYCQDPLFAAVCRATCQDQIPAAQCDADIDVIFADQTSYCGGDAPDCESPFIQAVCPVTCAGRQLSAEEPSSFRRPSVSPNIRARLSALNQREIAGEAGRGLSHVDERIVYKSCSSCGMDCQASLPSGGWRSYFEYNQCLPQMTVTMSCPTTTNYHVELGTYCKAGNIDTINHIDPEIDNNRCSKKCGTRVSDFNPDTGEWDWCSGNNWPHRDPTPEDYPDDLALCLPLEKCEELCTRLGDECESIDKHRVLPRCYLNKKGMCPLRDGMDVCGAEVCEIHSLTNPSAIRHFAGGKSAFGHATIRSYLGNDDIGATRHIKGPIADCSGSCGAGGSLADCTDNGGSTCLVRNLIGDKAFLWDLWEKKAPFLEPAYSMDADGTEGYNDVDSDGNEDGVYHAGNGPLYDGSMPGSLKGLTSEQLRHTFKPHTGMNCVPEDKLLVDFRPKGFYGVHDAETFQYAVWGKGTAIDYEHWGKAYPSTCERYCRYNDECAGFQVSYEIVSATSDGVDTSYQSLSGEEFLGSPEGLSYSNVVYCWFFKWTDGLVEDGAPTCPPFAPSFNDTSKYDKMHFVDIATGAEVNPAGDSRQELLESVRSLHLKRRPTIFMQKEIAPMCTATVSGLPPESKQFEGEYVKSGTDSITTYTTAYEDKVGGGGLSYKLPKYAENLKPGQWDKIDYSASLLFESDNGCDSWGLYENLVETEALLEVCVDFAEAAGAYMEMMPTPYTASPPEDGVYPHPFAAAKRHPDTKPFPSPGNITFGALEFPCQSGVDRGYCDNMVFAGLCPHSCQPMIEYFNDQGPREQFMLWHNYVSYLDPMDQREVQYSQEKLMYEDNERFLALFGDDTCDDTYGGANDGICQTNCTTGKFGKLTDCTDCLGATSLFCDSGGTNFKKSQSSCGGDNNIAMMFFALESPWIDELNTAMTAAGKTNTMNGQYLGYTAFVEEMYKACENVIDMFYTVTDYPCKPNPRMDHRIVQALCPAKCAGDDPDPPTDAPPGDEGDPSGASRRLGTVSWSGKMTELGKLTATYKYKYPAGPIDFSAPENTKLIYRTYAKDGVDSNSWYHDDTCAVTTPLNTVAKTGTAFDKLDDCWYRTDLLQVDPSDLTLQQVCRGMSACPELMTCVMQPSRFHDEMAIWRYEIGSPLTRQQHLMQIDSRQKDELFATSHYVPKVLISGERVEAIMTDTTLPYFPSVYRAEPDAMRLEIVNEPGLTVTGRYLVVVLFKPEAGDLEGGHIYELTDNIKDDYASSWLSDVIRIERFAADTSSLETGAFTMDLDIVGFDPASLSGPNGQAIDVFRFPPVAGAPPKSIIGEAGFSMALTPDGSKLRLTVPQVEGDLVLIQDKNECAGKCDPLVGLCQNTKPGYTCDCPSTHDCQGTDCGTCKMKAQSLPKYYLLLSHTSRLDYGWRVDQVQFYASKDCSGAALDVGVDKGIKPPSSLADHGLGSDKYYPDATDDKYDATKVGGAGAWWSACITCNPDAIFDETHGGPAQLEWEVNGDVNVGCMKVEQGSVLDSYGGHASRGLKVERGPVSRASPPCGGDGIRCQPTMTVTATCGTSQTDTCASTSISLACGMADTLLWGEILEPPGTEQFGFFGSYGNDGGIDGTVSVPSACHCHELCISNTASKCRSYKFFDDGVEKHCVLQTSEFFTYHSGVVGAPPGSSVAPLRDYTSGTPMDRFADAFVGKTRTLGAAKPWVESFSFADGLLSVYGYGLPTKNSVTKADRGRYQRIKIVTRGAPCSSAVPSAVSGIGCVNTKLMSYAEPHQSLGFTGKDEAYRTNEQTVYTVCSTRPTSWSSEVVTWDGISISAGSLEKSYDVCYCDGKECSRPESWLRVPPLTAVDGIIGVGDYTYVASSESVERGGSVDMKVTGPAFGAFDASNWELKVVPSHFACTVNSPYDMGTRTVVSTSEASFMFSFTGGLSSIGEYTVCLSVADGEPFMPLAGTISVVALGTDRTHAPMGAVYREQRWSALTGGATRTLKLKGTMLPAVSDSKVVLSHGMTCAWPDYSFGGVVKRQPTMDKTAPQILWSSTSPATGETVSSMTTIKVVFNELLSEPDNCLGGYTLKPLSGGPTYAVINAAPTYFIACDSPNKTIIDNFIMLEFDSPPAGTYGLFFDSYTIADLDGNSMFLTGSLDETTGDAVWVFTVGTDTTPPLMLTSEPKYGLVTSTGVISLTFSEPVMPDYYGYADLVDCGDDFVCDSADPMIAKYEFSDPLVGVALNETEVFTIDLTSIVDVYNFKRYSLTFAAGSFKDISTDNPAPETILEFLKDTSAAFDIGNVIGPSSSGTEELTYDLELTTPPGTYSLCYCDAQMDSTLFEAGDGKTTAKPAFGQKAAASTAFTDMPVGSRMLSAHVCSTKCAAGCVGDDCFCSGFEQGAGDMSEVYCLSPSLCRSVCDDLGADCAGFGTKGMDSCVLYPTGFVLAPAGAWTSYTKEMGTACTDPYEFTALVGKATVTARADVYVEYVVEPNVVTSLEIAGTNMISMQGGMALSSDRIMVVDCDGMCGYSAASASVTLEGSGGWNDLGPYQWGIDKPHEDLQNEETDTWSPKSWTAHERATGEYIPVANSYCTGNLDISTLAPIAMEGHDRSPTIHLCYNKCIQQDCVGEDCFCGGAYTGYDTSSSNALCADEALCKHLCDSYESCKSIDMAKDMTRCFLNTDFCDATPQDKAPTQDPKYDLLIKVIDQRRMLESQKPSAVPQERSLLPAMASGYSHMKLLIFQGVKFTSGGTFKVCFCDSTLRGDEGCTLPEHYGVEVGEVQASGISCLLTNSLFNRKTCVPMGSAGGLRCYSGMPPDTEPPMYPDVMPDQPLPPASGPGEPVASTYCRLHPELCR
jgi:hypothetical protein